MTREIVAQVRRPALITTYGVGSLVAAGDDSVMICGLDEWTPGPIVSEPRLAASLGVREFRSPGTGGRNGNIPTVRFPEWVFCTDCRRLGPFWDIADDKRRCRACITTVTPSRFVSCCVAGHIEDFPYRAWAHQSAVTPTKGHELALRAQGHTSALSDLLVTCSCGEQRSMDGSFDSTALRGLKRCSGQRPWLAEPSAHAANCDHPLRTLQRGSSNIWFSITASAISIPSIANRADKFVERKLADANPDIDPTELARTFLPPRGCTVDDIRLAIIRFRTPAASRERPSERELRAEEYHALVDGLDDPASRDQFLCEPVDLEDTNLPDVIQQVSRVARLREVRALTGFTRVVPATQQPPTTPPVERADLSAAELPWLPAVEVLGEGIFVRLDQNLLNAWCRGRFPIDRAKTLLDALDAAAGRRAPVSEGATPRGLLLHSLAHVLINELSLTAGYPTASIRERIYDEPDQSGILLFTATADGGGSLGGLAAQSDPRRFETITANALRRATWCTTDPTCIESPPSGVNGANLAACHACLLLPETSCERFNQGLDRALLIGTPASPELGLFANWIHAR